MTNYAAGDRRGHRALTTPGECKTSGMMTKLIADRAGLCKCRVVGGCCPQQTKGQDAKLGPRYKTRKEFARKVEEAAEGWRAVISRAKNAKPLAEVGRPEKANGKVANSNISGDGGTTA
jgi:hypothetical protein